MRWDTGYPPDRSFGESVYLLHGLIEPDAPALDRLRELDLPPACYRHADELTMGARCPDLAVGGRATNSPEPAAANAVGSLQIERNSRSWEFGEGGLGGVVDEFGLIPVNSESAQ